MITEIISQANNQLKLLVCLKNTPLCHIETSPEITINDDIFFRVKVIYNTHDMNRGLSRIYLNHVFIRFFKKQHVFEDPTTHLITFTCKEFQIENEQVTCDSDIWHVMHQESSTTATYIRRIDEFTVDVSIEEIKSTELTFAPLHADEELTDFELRGSDGGVRVHRAVLAAASPVLRAMLAGAWKETTEGQVDIPHTTQSTLQTFKDYIYLNTLPETGLEQLLLFASAYMMPDLEQQCADKMVRNLTVENACDMLRFAAKNALNRLLLKIVGALHDDKVPLKDIWNHEFGQEY